MRNSGTRVNCLYSKTKLWFQLCVYPVVTGCNLQHASNFGISLDPSSWYASSSLGRVYSRLGTAWNCGKCPVSWVMKYCPFSTTFRNAAFTQNWLNRSFFESLSIRYSYYSNRKFWFAGSPLSKGTSVLIALSTIDCPITTSGRPAVEKSYIFYTHLRDCSAKTELINKDNCAKKQSQMFSHSQSESTVFRVLCFWAHPWTMESLHGKLDTTFCEFHQHLFRNLSQFPCGLSSFMDHFFWEPGPTNDHCPVPNFFANMETIFAFAKHSSSLSFLSQEMSWNTEMNRILPVKVSVFLGKLFHSVGSPLIPSQSLQFFRNCDPSYPVLPRFVDFGCWWTLPRHNTESEKTWTFARWRLMIASSPINDRYFYEFFSQRIESTLKISSCSLTILLIGRTFSSVWDLMYSWWNSDCLANSYPWMSLHWSSQP